ncbi:MAG: hypothetical protein CVV21_02205 [Candidatus Goldiibacteriota bacterium HGW-Goldbacteria-1]|jgi:hypothetical protein|nr:MAG: hypothetical protein CVV21_02205 [Candidatus Goldiibacteriota bacterium HGW-Goldbacteria-1]
MASWGTAISSNDTYETIRDAFFEKYDDGAEVKDITENILKEYKELYENPEELNNFWFALAKFQWECKALDKEIFERVKGIIDSGSDIELWKKTEDVQEEDILRRQKVLRKFIEELSSEKFTARKRKNI